MHPPFGFTRVERIFRCATVIRKPGEKEMADLTINVNGKATDKSYDACVGERLNFSVTCSKGIVVDPRWHVSGAAVCGDFQMTNNRSTETLATIGDGITASWCFTCTGQARVIFDGKIDGKTHAANLNISISTPKIVEFSAKTDDIHIGLVDSEFHQQGALYLTFGGLKSTKKPGIEWTAKLIGSPSKAGSYAFVQLMKIHRQKSLNKNLLVNMSGSSDGEWVLDEDVFYGTSESTDPRFKQKDGEPEDFITARWPCESTLIKGEDSPATPLFVNMPKEEHLKFDEIMVEEHFQTHLMFRPNVPDSIWVSIARLDWFWKASAQFTKAKEGENGKWTLLGKDFEIDPIASKGYDLPIWSKNRNKILKV
jgi:hypothetical protein